jgi:hypothetical protein
LVQYGRPLFTCKAAYVSHVAVFVYVIGGERWPQPGQSKTRYNHTNGYQWLIPAHAEPTNWGIYFGLLMEWDG